MAIRVLLVRFKIPGIHFECLGSGNQLWDSKVHRIVARKLASFSMPGPMEWFDVESTWHLAGPKGKSRRDVDNLRIKPVLDAVTSAQKIWRDDCFPPVRRVNRRGVLAPDKASQHVVIRIFGEP